MEKKWIQALGKLTYGIYVLTTFYEDEINGMIASWVSQVSYDPPLIMAAIHPHRYSHRLIEQSASFALNIVARNREEYLTRFKGDDPRRKFDGIRWITGKTGSPILKDCIAFADCTIKAVYNPGNHTLYIGEIVDADCFSDDDPLITSDYGGQYLGKS
jgi:flavin reductase (DIM6/NTAB) family NADH-FMN oxidoreductase RutF